MGVGEDKRHNYFVLDGGFEQFYYLTNDHCGEVILQLLCHPGEKAILDGILSQGLWLAPARLDDRERCHGWGNPRCCSLTPAICLAFAALTPLWRKWTGQGRCSALTSRRTPYVRSAGRMWTSSASTLRRMRGVCSYLPKTTDKTARYYPHRSGRPALRRRLHRSIPLQL